MPLSHAKALSRLVAKAMDEKKANDIVCLDLRPLAHAVCDFFVIGTALNRPHMESLQEAIEKKVYTHRKEKPYLRSPASSHEWIVIDYMDVMVHLFTADKRAFYQLETLWGDALCVRYPVSSAKNTPLR